MAQVMLVVHVTLGTQVIVEAHLALPAHSHDAVLLAAVTDDVGVTHPWVGKERWMDDQEQARRKMTKVINSTRLPQQLHISAPRGKTAHCTR